MVELNKSHLILHTRIRLQALQQNRPFQERNGYEEYQRVPTREGYQPYFRSQIRGDLTPANNSHTLSHPCSDGFPTTVFLDTFLLLTHLVRSLSPIMDTRSRFLVETTR